MLIFVFIKSENVISKNLLSMSIFLKYHLFLTRLCKNTVYLHLQKILEAINFHEALNSRNVNITFKGKVFENRNTF